MPVYIEEVEFTQENVLAAPVTSIDYLKGNLFQKINLRIKFRSEWWYKPTIDNPIVFADQIFKTDDFLTYPTNLEGFRDLNVGDTLFFSDGASSPNNGTYLISEKLNNYQVRLTDTSGAAVALTAQIETQGKLSLVQDPTGASLDFGLIENDSAPNFDSLVSGDLQRYEVSVLSGKLPALAPAPAVGKLDWQLGDCVFRNLTPAGDTDYTYTFEFNQVLFIHPFYLPHQLLDIQNQFPIAPRYFKKEACLKYVARIRAYREIQDHNIFQEGQITDKIGNTGWFNEAFNGGTATHFRVGDVDFGNSIKTIDPRVTTVCSVDIHTNVLVTTAGYPDYLCLNFILLPENDNDIKNRNEYLQENYLFDRAYMSEGALPIDGEQVGTGFQVLTDCEFSNIAPDSVTCNFRINFGADALAKIALSKNKGFLIAAYTQQAFETADDYNGTCVLLAVGEMATLITDDVVDATNTFLFHDQQDDAIATARNQVKVEDEVVAQTVLTIDQLAYPNAQIDNFEAQIVAKKAGEDDVVLEELDILVAGNPLQGTARSLNFSPVTGFEVNQQEIRYNYRAFRSPSDDSGLEVGYRVFYPFLYRWEYWEQQFLSTLPVDWLDTAEDFQGYNQEWFRIQALSGWDIFYRLKTNVSFQGTTHSTNQDSQLLPKTYLANTDWINEEILTFDDTTGVNIAGEPFIIQNKKTTVKANFTYNGGGSPDENDVYYVARLIPKEGGTYIANESLSSIWDRENGGLFIGDATGKIVSTENAGVFTGTFHIDHNQLPTGILNYTLSVSINFKSSASQSEFGEVQKADLPVLEIIDFNPPVIPKDENPFKNCCYPLRVFANASDLDDEFTNDFSAPIKILPKQYTCIMYMEKLINGTWTNIKTLTGSNIYGTNYDLGFHEKNNNKYVGYKINWGLVLDNEGVGKYRVHFDCGVGSLYSEEYCLDQFLTSRADKTVRINYTWNSIIGDQDQKRTRDYVGLNWQNQLRFDKAQFGNRASTFATEDVRFENGELRTVSKAFNDRFTLTLMRLPKLVYNLFLNDILLSDQIQITDYNAANFEEYVNYSVEIEGEVAPNYSGNRANVSLEANFKSKFDNNIKYYS